jgi:GTP-binding protein
MSIIRQAVFVSSFARYRHGMVPELPEIAVVGRSNVGKSSLINMLTGNSKLARISASPGKTRLINYFLIDRAYYLVDLPGYGFAKAPKSEQRRWGDMIEGYLKESPNLKAVFVLVDIRHRPSSDDKMMVDWLRAFGIPFYVLATKADKVSRAQQQRLLMDIAFDLKLDMLGDILVTSSQKKLGGQRVIDLMQKICLTKETENECLQSDEQAQQLADSCNM